MAFGDVGGNRDGRFPHLMRKTKAFPGWKVFRGVVDGIRKVHRFLPCDQITEAQNFSHASLGWQFQYRRYESLIPNP